MRLNSKQLKALAKIMNWGLQNFHTLEEESKVKVWLKICDKFQPDKEGEGVSKLLQMLLNAGQRRIEDKEGD
jgi:hypothetical protein